QPEQSMQEAQIRAALVPTDLPALSRFQKGLRDFASIRVLRFVLCTTYVQEGGFEGPGIGPKQCRINNRLLSYRPDLLAGNILRDLPHSSNNSARCVAPAARIKIQSSSAKSTR